MTKKTCFLDVEHVLLVSDFNQNRFDRFIFQGDILGSTAWHRRHGKNTFDKCIFDLSFFHFPYFRGVWDRGSTGKQKSIFRYDKYDIARDEMLVLDDNRVIMMF